MISEEGGVAEGGGEADELVGCRVKGRGNMAGFGVCVRNGLVWQRRQRWSACVGSWWGWRSGSKGLRLFHRVVQLCMVLIRDAHETGVRAGLYVMSK